MATSATQKGHACSPWLHGVTVAAAYAHVGVHEMERYVALGMVVSRHKPARANGSVPKGLLIYAPSIDELIMSQPSGANPITRALNGAA